MVRRIHVSIVQPGEILLDAAESHHALDVLRLTSGTAVEVFDDEGRVAPGIISMVAAGVMVRVEAVAAPRKSSSIRLTVASAIPKGDRADWMIQKLSELGVHQFIPLATARSVVVPAGKNKMQRWARLAIEAAKQSRRDGVMKIAEISQPRELIASLQSFGPIAEVGWCLSTRVGVRSIMQILQQEDKPERLTVMIGPEGGWTEEELSMFTEAGVLAVALTSTVLRVETAAIAAAAIIASWQS